MEGALHTIEMEGPSRRCPGTTGTESDIDPIVYEYWKGEEEKPDLIETKAEEGILQLFFLFKEF
jgi:hypothetical protein